MDDLPYTVNPAYTACRQATNRLTDARGAVDELRRLLPAESSQLSEIYNEICHTQGKLEALLDGIPHQAPDQP